MSDQGLQNLRLEIEEKSKKLEDSKTDFNYSQRVDDAKEVNKDDNKETSQGNVTADHVESKAKEIKLNFKEESDASNIPVKRELLKKLANVCGVTFYSNISTIEFDLEDYVKEILDDATNGSHDIKIREDGQRAGEEITLYDSQNKTMYHTAFSRLTRKEIESMLSLVKKFTPNGKYNKMRILPHSIKQIQDALEKAQSGKGLSPTKTEGKSTNRVNSKNDSEEDSNSFSPYGKWVRNLNKNTDYDVNIKEKYFTKATDSPKIGILEKEQSENDEMQKVKNKQFKLQKQYQEAQRINDMKLKQFMKRQREIRTRNEQDSQVSSLKDQINAAISRSNQNKLKIYKKNSRKKKSIQPNISLPSIKKKPTSEVYNAQKELTLNTVKIRSNINKSASPVGQSLVSEPNVSLIRKKLRSKKRKVKGDLNSQLKYSRNGADSRVHIHNMHTPQSKADKVYSAQKSTENIDPKKISHDILEHRVLRRNYTNQKPTGISTFNSSRVNKNLDQSLNQSSGYRKIKKRNKKRKVTQNGPVLLIDDNRSSNRLNSKTRIKIFKTNKDISFSSSKYPNFHNESYDYLLHRRIERETKPSNRWKKRNKCNISIRGIDYDDDFYKVQQRAREVTRKAMQIEGRILENQSEKEKMEQSHEVDTMLLDSLKAKISLLNQLSS
ncbi:unnamed protein product [Moneuplotes crassus]|uniref:Uncharacterized protein n=1 Tax=Euplotes crassus TaxID=5936 RepID=A0AAD2DAK7_EUPCR|nr:unnamed protein product [Moneuplotes crassus]